jgi:hypothetical protein
MPTKLTSQPELVFTYRCEQDDFTDTGSVKEVVQAFWDHEAAKHGAPHQTWEMLGL